MTMDAIFHQLQIASQETHGAAIGPSTGIRLFGIMIGTKVDLAMQFIVMINWTMSSGQLVMDEVCIETMSLIEESELFKDALHIATGQLIIGIIPGFVFLHQFSWYLQFGATFFTVSRKIFFGLYGIIMAVMNYMMIMAGVALFMMGICLLEAIRIVYKVTIFYLRLKFLKVLPSKLNLISL